MKTQHPALALFKTLFAEKVLESHTSPYPPENYVNRWQFHADCKRAGIETPDNVIEIWEWEEKIGLRKLARKLVDAEHKRIGETPAARRLRLRLRTALEK